jgi:hypothetical protein
VRREPPLEPDRDRADDRCYAAPDPAPQPDEEDVMTQPPKPPPASPVPPVPPDPFPPYDRVYAWTFQAWLLMFLGVICAALVFYLLSFV